MSSFILEEPTKNGFVKGLINDVTFLYVHIQEARDKFSKDGQEYSVKLVVDKETAKAFKKQYSKQGFSECETENFEEQYGIAPPHPKEEIQYLITLKAPDDHIVKSVGDGGEEVETAVKLGYGEFKRPKVYVPSTEGVKDITRDLLVGNGSRGHASFWELSTTTYGEFARLSGILVSDLKVYEKRAGSQSAWGSVVNVDSSPENHFAQQAQEEAPTIPDDQIPY